MSRAVALLLALGALVLPSIARAHGRGDVRVPGRVDVRVPGRVDVRVPGRVDVRVPGRASGAVVAELEDRLIWSPAAAGEGEQLIPGVVEGARVTPVKGPAY